MNEYRAMKIASYLFTLTLFLARTSGLAISTAVHRPPHHLSRISPPVHRLPSALSLTPLSDSSITSNPIADTSIFVVGLIPFVWATVEFNRRVLKGLPFGTGKIGTVRFDSSTDKAREESGTVVLGKGALLTSYILFGVAGATIFVSIAAVIS